MRARKRERLIAEQVGDAMVREARYRMELRDKPKLGEPSDLPPRTPEQVASINREIEYGAALPTTNLAFVVDDENRVLVSEWDRTTNTWSDWRRA